MTHDEIAAHLEIQALKARYFRCVDGKDWEQLESLFVPDATLFFPEAQEEPLALRKSIAFIAEGIGEGVSIHHGHMPEISIHSPTRASAIWAMEDRIYWPADRASPLGLRTLHGFGHYHEDYEKVDGRWLIRSLKVVRIHASAVPAGAQAPSWAL